MAHSFEEKLKRANQHLTSLDNQIENWTLKNPYIVTHNFDPNRGELGRYVVKIKLTIPPPEQIPILIGECLFNFRCALDHLVFNLAEVRNGGPLSDEIAKRTEFPISQNNIQFSSQRKSKIGGIHPDAQTFIESLQPYRRGYEFQSHNLWRLNEMQNIDKHRALLVTYTAHQGSMIWPAQPADFISGRTELAHFKYIRNLSPFEAEAEIAEYGYAIGQPHVKMNLRPHLQIAFSRSPIEGAEVISFLSNIRDYLLSDVIPRLRTFL